jgi:hypothetical protein
MYLKCVVMRRDRWLSLRGWQGEECRKAPLWSSPQKGLGMLRETGPTSLFARHLARGILHPVCVVKKSISTSHTRVFRKWGGGGHLDPPRKLRVVEPRMHNLKNDCRGNPNGFRRKARIRFYCTSNRQRIK